MRKAKYSPRVYATLSAQGMSNRAIAQHLGVNEASVRRGLAKKDESSPKRVTIIVIEE